MSLPSTTVMVHSGSIGAIMAAFQAINRLQGKRRIIITSDTPYPCDLDRGILTGGVIRFSPRAQVAHQPDIPCRKKGDASCTYSVSW